jgi:hypothetical protein
MQVPWELPLRLRELPFDIFQRYWSVLWILDQAGIEPGAGVLEVGGAGGYMRRFAPERRIVTLDLSLQGEGDPDVVASGTQLPFAPASFAAVVALDTLEHVPSAERRRFLEECLRAAARLVVLTFPQRGLVEEAERRLAALQEGVSGAVCGFLDEHLQEELPDAGEVIGWAEPRGWVGNSLPHGTIDRWELWMQLEVLLVNFPYGGELRKRVHALGNTMYTLADFAASAYRSLVVLRPAGSDPVELVAPEARPGAEVVSEARERVVAAALEWRRRIGELDEFAKKLQGDVAQEGEERLALERYCRRQQERIAELERELQAAQAALADRATEVARLAEREAMAREEQRMLEKGYQDLAEYVRKVEKTFLDSQRRMVELDLHIARLSRELYRLRVERLEP